MSAAESRPSLPPELARLAAASPFDAAISGLVAWLGSVEFQRRARALAAHGGPVTVGELAAIFGAPAEAIQIWIARDLAALTGESVQARLGSGPGGPVAVEYTRLHRGRT